MLALQGSVGDCGGEKGIRSGGLRRKWGIGRSEPVNCYGQEHIYGGFRARMPS